MKTLSSSLTQNGLQRFERLSEKWSDIAYTPVGKEISIYLFACSEFIFYSALKYQAIAQQLLTLRSQEDLMHVPEFAWHQAGFEQEAVFMSALRKHRHHWFTLIAARDFLSLTDIVDTMRKVSDTADFYFAQTRAWAIEHLKPRWGTAVGESDRQIELIALGMGKLGGFELNFSSDIDLIFAYSEKGATSGGRKSEDFQAYFTKVAQKIIHLLDTQTADGRVFRVDMRLRPFGDSGPLVSSFDALEDYYQEQGRDWERYALLKARPMGLAGEITESEQNDQHALMTLLKPFVYRRYIDFSVIDSLRNMKRMIRSEVKRRKLINNIKLGEGGIREAEFIVQALQMLRGGKEPQFQTQSLLKVLPELVTSRLFSSSEINGIREAYLFLRQIEQHLQAFNDKQTQTLPDDDESKLLLAELNHSQNWTQFSELLEHHMRNISSIFSEFIGDEPEHESELEFDGNSHWLAQWTADDESGELEFQWLRNLKQDLFKVSTGARGREKLEQLIPVLLAECESQNLRKRSVTAIVHLLRKIASRTTYLELLLENSGARAQLVKLIQASPYIGEQLTQFPLLLDLLIDPKLLYQPPEIAEYGNELRRFMLRVEVDDLEQQMEMLRQFKLSSELVVAACDIEGVIPLPKVSDHLTALAHACLAHAVEVAWQQLKQRYGLPEGATDIDKQFGVVAYGKMAGFELGYGSDLDLVFIHACQTSAATNGKKPIDSRQFYIKLAQRIVHIFTTKMHSGELYELDTRLRPSGASGLLAINVDTFKQYQLEEAWAWEHQALVRSRFVFGDESLSSRFAEIRHHVLTHSRHQSNIAQEVSSMRHKMQQTLSKETESLFDLKQSRGGIADIEFISQYLVLQNAQSHPELMKYPDNLRILEQAGKAGLITERQSENLIECYIEYRRLYHMAAINGDVKLVKRERVEQYSVRVSDIWREIGLS